MTFVKGMIFLCDILFLNTLYFHERNATKLHINYIEHLIVR
jgi:hypothetical protein